jgi:hypothetical protein
MNTRTPRTKRAIRYVWEGMSRYAAAHRAKIDIKTIYRAFPLGSTLTCTNPIPDPVSTELPDQSVNLSTGLKSN